MQSCYPTFQYIVPLALLFEVFVNRFELLYGVGRAKHNELRIWLISKIATLGYDDQVVLVARNLNRFVSFGFRVEVCGRNRYQTVGEVIALPESRLVTFDPEGLQSYSSSSKGYGLGFPRPRMKNRVFTGVLLSGGSLL